MALKGTNHVSDMLGGFGRVLMDDWRSPGADGSRMV